jgi:predicted DNA-binding protein (MmcQ/YjbR family)
MIEPTFKEIVDIFSSFENVSKSTPFTDDVDVYKVDDQMFALVVNNKLPIRLSLRCDQNLSKVLLEKYESVMLGQKLDQEKWITIVLTGQVPLSEIQDLILLSYTLAKEDS